jgi:hypothetical protein
MEDEEQDNSSFTEEEKHENYCVLSNAMNDIVNNKVNYEWIKEHSRIIIRYREWISDYSKVSPEIEDAEFRIQAEGIEFFLNCLCDQLKKHGTFDINVYFRLNQYIKHVVDYKIPVNEENDLVNLISAMKVTST